MLSIHFLLRFLEILIKVDENQDLGSGIKNEVKFKLINASNRSPASGIVQRLGYTVLIRGTGVRLPVPELFRIVELYFMLTYVRIDKCPCINDHCKSSTFIDHVVISDLVNYLNYSVTVRDPINQTLHTLTHKLSCMPKSEYIILTKRILLLVKNLILDDLYTLDILNFINFTVVHPYFSYELIDSGISNSLIYLFVNDSHLIVIIDIFINLSMYSDTILHNIQPSVILHKTSHFHDKSLNHRSFTYLVITLLQIDGKYSLSDEDSDNIFKLLLFLRNNYRDHGIELEVFSDLYREVFNYDQGYKVRLIELFTFTELIYISSEDGIDSCNSFITLFHHELFSSEMSTLVLNSIRRDFSLNVYADLILNTKIDKIYLLFEIFTHLLRLNMIELFTNSTEIFLCNVCNFFNLFNFKAKYEVLVFLLEFISKINIISLIPESFCDVMMDNIDTVNMIYRLNALKILKLKLHDIVKIERKHINIDEYIKKLGNMCDDVNITEVIIVVNDILEIVK